MFTNPIIKWIKSLFDSFNKSQTYGSTLEAYIIANNPSNIHDIDYLTRQYDRKQHKTIGWVL